MALSDPRQVIRLLLEEFGETTDCLEHEIRQYLGSGNYSSESISFLNRNRVSVPADENEIEVVEIKDGSDSEGEENGIKTITASSARRDEVKQPVGDRIVSFIELTQPILRPFPFVPHECDVTCNQEIEFTPLRGHNPYTFPSLAGWTRLVYETSLTSNGKTVAYVAPCGRNIRTMDEIQRFIRTTECSLGVEYFTFEPDIELFRQIASVPYTCFNYDADFSRGQENQPISMVNTIDKCRIDPRFSYCSQRFPGPGVKLNLEPEFLSCCNCSDNCLNPFTCPCQNLTSEGFDVIPGLADVSVVRGYRYKRLMGAVPFGVYEW